MHVRAWGAVDARQPTTSRPQVRFRKDYSGRYWTSVQEPVPRLRRAEARLPGCCLRRARRLVLGAPILAQDASELRRPSAEAGSARWELHLSHWSGAIATLDAWTDWVYDGRYHHLFGRLTYDGKPVYGFSATRVGSPRDVIRP